MTDLEFIIALRRLSPEGRDTMRRILEAGGSDAPEAPANRPILTVYREWLEAKELADAPPDRVPVEQLEAQIARAYRLADEVMAQPSASLADTLLKVAAYTFLGVHELGDDGKGKAILAELLTHVELTQ